MKITIEIADDDIRAALQTAAESGIGYWARGFMRPTSTWNPHKHVLVESLELVQVDPNTQRRTHKLDIERGLRMMFTDLFPCRQYETPTSPAKWDARTADCFVQYAAFGKLVYS